MGFADRDYNREPSTRPSGPNFRAWSVTTWLIAINVAVFLLNLILRSDNYADGPLTEWGYFSLNMGVYHWQLWRFITFQFLHANPEHILFNMIGLYFFGPFVESYLGSRPFIAFYLICGVSGALSNILLNYLGFLRDGPMTPMVGASAGIYGILVAAALIAPDIPVMLLILPIPMRLRTMALLCIGFAVYTVLMAGHNAGGEAAHLGGALVGFLLIKNIRILNFMNFGRRSLKYGGKRVVYKDWSKDMNR